MDTDLESVSAPSDTPTPDRARKPIAAPGALGLAAVASAGAGLVHAAAAGSHPGDRTLSMLFALSAVAQVGWAAVASRWPSRTVALGGVVLNSVMALAWIASRTVGLPLVDSLAEPEAAGLQDTAAALLAVSAVLGAVAALRPIIRLRGLPSSLGLGAAGVVVALAVPAMVAQHDHDGGTSGHDDHVETASNAHDHVETGPAPADEGELAGVAGGDHHHEMPERLDHEPTEEQRDDARQLIAETEEGLARYADVDDAVAAGYVSIGDSPTGVEHFVNREYLRNETFLDPSQPESLVYKVLPDDGRELTTAMYILPPGSTMDDAPDIAGNLTVWHDHDNLCWDQTGTRLAGILIDGQCRPGGTLRQTPPMLHVWITPNECGPFAGTDSGQMTGSCIDPGAI